MYVNVFRIRWLTLIMHLSEELCQSLYENVGSFCGLHCHLNVDKLGAYFVLVRW
jgi:hypothetical protein